MAFVWKKLKKRNEAKGCSLNYIVVRLPSLPLIHTMAYVQDFPTDSTKIYFVMIGEEQKNFYAFGWEILYVRRSVNQGLAAVRNVTGWEWGKTVA